MAFAINYNWYYCAFEEIFGTAVHTLLCHIPTRQSNTIKKHAGNYTIFLISFVVWNAGFYFQEILLFDKPQNKSLFSMWVEKPGHMQASARSADSLIPS
jgi:hypothetical protein